MILGFLIIIPVILLLSLRYLFVRSQLSVSVKAERVLLILGSGSFLLMLATYQLERYNLYFAGYRTTTYIMFSAAVFVVLYYLLGAVPAPKLQGLQFIKFVLSLFLLINAFFVTDGFTFRFTKNLIYNDGPYRIQKVDGIMTSQYELWVNEGIFDRAYKLHFKEFDSGDSIEINEIGPDSVYINIFHKDNVSLPNPQQIRMKL